MAFTIRVGQHLNYISYGCCECFVDSTRKRSAEIRGGHFKTPHSDVESQTKNRSPMKRNSNRLFFHSYVNDKTICQTLSLKLYHIFVLYFLISPLFVCLLQRKELVAIRPVSGCRPGPYPSIRPAPKKLEPLKFRQHVPNVSEKTIGASGPSEGKIVRDSKRFREELTRNLNSNIIFKDEERTNADKMMTQRCKDRLDRLAIMVSEHWDNKVRLRVTEAWDEDWVHPPNSLHYEGRAVDITTNDRDRRKYGMLARLAVEAGFDWVHYESKSHIHCSVKADKSDAALYGGCFSGSSFVTKPDGHQIPMSEVKPGDNILTTDSSGRIVVDQILTFLHRTRPSQEHLFKQLTLENGNSITLTSNHLIKTTTGNTVMTTDIDTETPSYEALFLFVKNVKRGDLLFASNLITSNSTFEHNTPIGNITLQRVDSVKDVSLDVGVYAPLTRSGTLLVNGMVASCYAVIENHEYAHFALSPLRYLHVLRNWLQPNATYGNSEGVSWYPKILLYIASNILSETSIYI